MDMGCAWPGGAELALAGSFFKLFFVFTWGEFSKGGWTLAVQPPKKIKYFLAGDGYGEMTKEDVTRI
jgi:hypothetical protein